MSPNQPLQIWDWYNQQAHSRWDQHHHNLKNADQPMEKHIQRPEMVQKLRPRRKPLIHVFWCMWLLPLNHRKTSLQSTLLRHYLQTHQRRWKGNHFSLQAIPAIFQWLPLGEKTFFQQIWRNNGIFRWPWNMWASGLLSIVLPTQKVWQQHRPIHRRWFSSVQHKAPNRSKKSRRVSAKFSVKTT